MEQHSIAKERSKKIGFLKRLGIALKTMLFGGQYASQAQHELNLRTTTEQLGKTLFDRDLGLEEREVDALIDQEEVQREIQNRYGRMANEAQKEDGFD